MTTKVGVLGESVDASLGTGKVAYQVPGAKGARVKIMYRGIAGVNSVLAVYINGIEVFRTAALTSGNISHTTTGAEHVTQAASAITGGTDATTVAPGPKEYYLSANDTVSYDVATASFSSLNVQVVGTEVDVA